MRRKKTPESSLASAASSALVMRLYIARNAPNSILAIENLAAICEEFGKDTFRLEIVDVLEDPLRALADGILVTPSLAKLEPFPAAQIIGNLNNKKSVLRALGVNQIGAVNA